MPTQDIRSDIVSKQAFNANIATDTTTNGAIIDTADFHTGSFALQTTAYTDGTYTPVLEESDDAGMSGANDVADDNIIGTEAGAAISAATVSGAVLNSIGFFGTKRYVRLKIASTGTTTGADINAIFIGNPRIKPSPDLSA